MMVPPWFAAHHGSRCYYLGRLVLSLEKQDPLLNLVTQRDGKPSSFSGCHSTGAISPSGSMIARISSIVCRLRNLSSANFFKSSYSCFFSASKCRASLGSSGDCFGPQG